LGPYDVLEEHPRHPRSWSRSRHALTCGSDVSELVWRPVEDGLLYWSPFALLARPLRPPPGRVGPEGPSAEIRAIPDSAPFVLDNPVGFQASPASALPAPKSRPGLDDRRPASRKSPIRAVPPAAAIHGGSEESPLPALVERPAPRHLGRIPPPPAAVSACTVSALGETAATRPESRATATQRHVSGSKTDLRHRPGSRAEARRPFR
jgi:hypothetical protein